MKKSLYLIAGILIGITLFGGSSVLAAGITAERSTNRIYVNGQEVHLTAYNINGNNYVMLRDVGKTVSTYWSIPAERTCAVFSLWARCIATLKRRCKSRSI